MHGLKCWRPGSKLCFETLLSIWQTDWLHVPEAHKIVQYKSQMWFSRLAKQCRWRFKIMVYCYVRNKQAKSFWETYFFHLRGFTSQMTLMLIFARNSTLVEVSGLKRTCQSHIYQGRQRMYNVTMRCVRASIVAVEKQWVLHNMSARVCSLRYPACNAHAPYFQLRPVPL